MGLPNSVPLVRLAATIGVSVVLAFALTACTGQQQVAKGVPGSSTSQPMASITSLASPTNKFARATIERSVVTVDGGSCGARDQGTGFAIAPEDVVTAAHVVGAANHSWIVTSSRTYLLSDTVYESKVLDLAVLRTSSPVGKPLLIQSRPLAVGSPVEIIGYPNAGPLQIIKGRVTGVVDSGVVRLSTAGSIRRIAYQLDAHVAPGMSGAPVIGPNGKVAGILYARSTSPPNVAFALALSSLRHGLRFAEQQSPLPRSLCAPPGS